MQPPFLKLGVHIVQSTCADYSPQLAAPSGANRWSPLTRSDDRNFETVVALFGMVHKSENNLMRASAAGRTNATTV